MDEIERFLFHKHPLILSENAESVDCYVCGSEIENMERAFVCVEEERCAIKPRLHQRCGELATPILHSSHPHHPLHLFDFRQSRLRWCDLCRRHFGDEFGYRCDKCDFVVDIKCKKLGKDELFGEAATQLKHPTHIHPLTLIRKPLFVFNCDACNTEKQDMAYTCTVRNLFLHNTCASLPVPLPTICHPHHHLSLSSCFPFHHRNFQYKCDVCDTKLDMTCWVYYCDDCRYFAHFKCATSPIEQDSNLNEEKNDDGSDVVEFPLQACDISKELITPLVMREIKITDVKNLPAFIKMPETTSSYSLLYNYHKHLLSLVSDKIKEAVEDEDEDEDEEPYIKICDVCISPISSSPYYECAASACKYFVHSTCCLLPNTLSSELYGKCQMGESHKFTQYTSSDTVDKGDSDLACNICWFPTNGMVYECEKCEMKIDVKCASLPTTIKHAFHPHHKLIKFTLSPQEGEWYEFKCYCCGLHRILIGYRCTTDGCGFTLDARCVQLPQSIMNRELDKHPLLLTCDASFNHPTDFYCDICERQMHPKSWMYHCCECDNSYHIDCLKTTSGWCRNMKYGQQFELDGLHPHSLTFNLTTFKRRCDHSYLYPEDGFECASCYYAVCRKCGIKELRQMM